MFQSDSIKAVISKTDTVKATKTTATKAKSTVSDTVKIVTNTIKPTSVATAQPAIQSSTVQRTVAQPTDTVTADTLLISDSTTAMTNIIAVEATGKIGNQLPTATSNSTWIFTNFIFLLLLLSIALKLEKNKLLTSIKSLFVRNTEASDSFKIAELIKPEKYFIISLFTIGVWSLGLEILFNPFFAKTISVLSILYRGGILVVFFIVKHILFEIVGRTFLGKNATKLFKTYYFNLLFYLSVLLLPILIAYVYIPETRVVSIVGILIGVVAVTYTVLLFKILQTFYSKLLDLFYIFLYFCTLEILPLIILIEANKLIDF